MPSLSSGFSLIVSLFSIYYYLRLRSMSAMGASKVKLPLLRWTRIVFTVRVLAFYLFRGESTYRHEVHNTGVSGFIPIQANECHHYDLFLLRRQRNDGEESDRPKGA